MKAALFALALTACASSHATPPAGGWLRDNVCLEVERGAWCPPGEVFACCAVDGCAVAYTEDAAADAARVCDGAGDAGT